VQFQINFTNNISMIYDLADEEIAQKWANLIVQRNTSELCKINHYTGYGSAELINSRIQRLYELADAINQYDNTRIIKQEINKDTWKVALHIMHVHFPEMKNDPKYQEAWPFLTEYNDIIHWLESVLLCVWSSKMKSESSLFRVALDFNKTVFEFYDLPESAYKLFTPFTKFGDLSLHYTHVGKHAQELFIVNDFECPPEQFVPQRTFNASCRLYLTDDFFNHSILRDHYISRWNKFYNDRGALDFWKLDINDPKIVFGYCKIGEINTILVDNTKIKIPTSLIELNNIRQMIAESIVIDWEIK
jgi:hypothetical protein